MVIKHISSIISQAQGAETLTADQARESAGKIVAALNETNLIDAYVFLDYLKTLTETALSAISDKTINHIRKTGDNEALGVELGLFGTKEIAFHEDPSWNEINTKLTVYKDALTNREELVKHVIESTEGEGQKPPINYTVNISIIPKAVPAKAESTEPTETTS